MGAGPRSLWRCNEGCRCESVTTNRFKSKRCRYKVYQVKNMIGSIAELVYIMKKLDLWDDYSYHGYHLNKLSLEFIRDKSEHIF